MQCISPLRTLYHSSPIVLRTPSTGLRGEIWACNTDPNGVFEPKNGTKLRRIGTGFPSILVGNDRTLSGNNVSNLGIQGDIVGMDTRAAFDAARPWASAGLYFGRERVDQGDFSKISCCGLACAVSIAEDAEIDACDFRKINADGSCVGIYFSPRASYYARFYRCVVADTPSYGFFADGHGKWIHNMDIADCHFVRNAGANHLTGHPSAAVCLSGLSRCSFRDNLVDAPGVFWYFEPTATENTDKTVYEGPALGLWVEGNENRITGNVFLNSSAESVYIKGKGNVLMNNTADGDVVIAGEGNFINGLAFTKPDARLILTGAAAGTTRVFGVEENRIVRRPD
jgi:parallel beta-helix repeat protein